MGSDGQYAYDAFVSYSRQADGEFAQALVGAIRSYFGFRRGERLRIIRDTESLTVASGLTAELERNLADSRYLVLLASPRAATSSYVELTVNRRFKRCGVRWSRPGGARNLLAIRLEVIAAR